MSFITLAGTLRKKEERELARLDKKRGLEEPDVAEGSVSLG